MATTHITTLFIGQFLDYVPTWFSPALMIGGFYLLFVGHSSDLWKDNFRIIRPFGVFLVSFGICLIGISLYIRNAWWLTVMLTSFSRWIEGVAAVKTYRKIASLIRGYDVSSESKFVGRIRFHVVILFLLVVGGWAIIALLVYGPIQFTRGYFVALVWTLLTVIISLIGMSWKFWSIRNAKSSSTLLGFLLITAGAEIYNYSSLFLDFSSFTISNISYSMGYWFAIGLWLLSNESSSNSTTRTSSIPSYRVRAVPVIGALHRRVTDPTLSRGDWYTRDSVVQYAVTAAIVIATTSIVPILATVSSTSPLWKMRIGLLSIYVVGLTGTGIYYLYEDSGYNAMEYLRTHWVTIFVIVLFWILAIGTDAPEGIRNLSTIWYILVLVFSVYYFRGVDIKDDNREA